MLLPEVFGKEKKGNARLSKRRSAVLNALFAERISDILASSTINHTLDQHGFFLTKVVQTLYRPIYVFGTSFVLMQVKYADDASAVHVYWSADSDIVGAEKQLSGIAGRLRHELSQLQSGRVPHINFIYGNCCNMRCNHMCTRYINLTPRSNNI